MCWSNHRAASFPSVRQARSPAPRVRDDVRVSDADRDDTIRLLSQHTGEGRLTLEEFEERVEEVLHARTRGDLNRSLRELPVGRVGRAPARSQRTVALAAWAPLALRVAVAVLAVALLGPWVLWFAIPIIVCGRGWHRHHHWSGGEGHAGRHARDEDLTLV